MTPSSRTVGRMKASGVSWQCDEPAVRIVHADPEDATGHALLLGSDPARGIARVALNTDSRPSGRNDDHVPI